MKKFAFEVSDNIAIYAHMLPLLKACIDDAEIIVSLYSVSAENFDKLALEFEYFYDDKLVVYEKEVLADSTLAILKKKTVAFAKQYKLTKMLFPLREMFTSLRKNKKNKLDDATGFYKKNELFFAKQDVLLTTELKGGELEGSPKLIWLLHGIISNDNPFYKSWLCDLVVSPQVDFIEQLKLKTDFPNNSHVYQNAYLKYDLIKLSQLKHQANFFNEKKYTVVYNPHWDSGSGQSSWFAFGEQVLEFFFNHKNINLIFAPHISLSKFYDIKVPDKYYACDNIHIDLNSANLVRGNYIAFADCYLGDVSSQYFEYLLCKPSIDAIFFNVTKFDWRASNIYSYWQDGEVIEDPVFLENALHLVQKNKKNRCQRFYNIPDNQTANLLSYLKSTYLE